MVIDDGHLRSILRNYFEYYHRLARNGLFEISVIIARDRLMRNFRDRENGSIGQGDLVILSRDVHKTDLKEIER
jgi:hypothetical protein